MVQFAMLMACWIVWQGVASVPQVGTAHCPVQTPLEAGVQSLVAEELMST